MCVKFKYKDIIYRNNNYYVFQYFPDEPYITDTENFHIYVLNKNFNVIRKIYLPLKEPFTKDDVKNYQGSQYYTGIEVLSKQEKIFIPIISEAEIYMYSRK